MLKTFLNKSNGIIGMIHALPLPGKDSLLILVHVFTFSQLTTSI